MNQYGEWCAADDGIFDRRHLDQSLDAMLYGPFSYFRKPLLYRYISTRKQEKRVQEDLDRARWTNEVERKLVMGLALAAQGKKIDWDRPPDISRYREAMTRTEEV